MPLWRLLALALLGAGVASILAIWLVPPTGDFHRGNPFWNGLTDLADRHDTELVASMADLPEDPADSALLVVPSRRPTTADIALLQTYLQGGGTLILADDYGFGNVILEGLGTPYRFDGAPLIDALFNYRSGAFPLATDIDLSPLTSGVSQLALNYGTVLEGPDLTVIARSSVFSYLDRNGNERRDPEDPTGPFPVVGYSSVGPGRLILISDPSIFINSMLEAQDNARFVANLVESTSSPARILLDQSLLPVSNLTWAKARLADLREGINRPTVLAVLVTALVAGLTSPTWRRKEQLLEPERP